MYLHSLHDPYQPLNRRWLRAAYLVERGQRPSPVHDDGWVERAVSFRAALGGCHDEADRLRLAEEQPAIFEAHALYHADPPLLRWAVEARILAREPFADIARKCGLLAEAVEAYEALFFCVLDKLGADTWVVCQVIGPKIFHGLMERDLDAWWKVVGYGLGPVALDALLHGTLASPQPQTAEEVGEALAREAESLFR